MESLVNQKLFSGIYQGKKVFVTGHTGFKGTWLCYWLKMLGAEVYGYSLAPNTEPHHYGYIENIFNQSTIGDIRNEKSINDVLDKIKPDIVFHLAAQPLVRLSYADPVTTFDTNIIGSLKVYEAIRKCPSIKAVVCITTDKVYENNEWNWGYRENDRLGGLDPYSASKAMMELLTTSYRHSFLNTKDFGNKHNTLMATARAGNVIGGGDWAQDRLIPDLMKNVAKNIETSIRNKFSTRPWQHVLEPLSAYLLLGEKLLNKNTSFAKAYNFGPSTEEDFTVEEVVTKVIHYWSDVKVKFGTDVNAPHEAGLLKLDCALAKKDLSWLPSLTLDQALELTVNWYKNYYEKNQINTESDILMYVSIASSKKAIWANR
jgi:CDP-glucose 4,6-dehydratase